MPGFPSAGQGSIACAYLSAASAVGEWLMHLSIFYSAPIRNTHRLEQIAKEAAPHLAWGSETVIAVGALHETIRSQFN